MNPILALIIANVIWGAASPIFKLALTNIPPFTLAFIRFFFAGLIFIPLTIPRWQRLTWKQFFEILMVGFFGITINISFFFLGLPKTTSINAPVIGSSGPIFIYIFSILFLKERPRKKIFAGMLLALIGVLIIVFSPIFINNKKLVLGEIEGNLFFIIATFGYVLQTITEKKIGQEINSFQISLITFLFGGLTFLPLAINEMQSWSFTLLNINGWIGIIYGVLFSSALSYFLYYYGLARLQAQEVGLFTYIDPVIAVVIAMPLLGEYPNIWFLVGGFLIFGGIFFAEKRIHYHPFHKLNKLISKSDQ